jgi:hypothetical protein
MASVLTFVLAAAATAVQFGWKPLESGGNEYIVEVEPELIDTFRKEGFSSDVPPELRDIRRIVIQVGTGNLPHQGEMTVLKPPLPGDVNGPHLAAPQFGAATTADNSATQPPSIYDRQSTGAVASAPPFSRGASSPPPLLSPNAAEADNSAAPLTRPATHPAQSAASFQDVSGSPSDSFVVRSGGATSANTTAPAEPNKPWLLLLGVTAGLIASAAANVYLGWMHWETRRRYQAVVDELHFAKA